MVRSLGCSSTCCFWLWCFTSLLGSTMGTPDGGNASTSTSTSARASGEGAPRAVSTDIHASYSILGMSGSSSSGSSSGASWLGAAQLPMLHASGLRGTGQVVGLGDTGVSTSSCSFADPKVQVPFDDLSTSHRKIAAYFTLHGDSQDGPSGHGTHIAGIIASEATELGVRGNGVAPAARLAVVDLELTSKPGVYNVPDDDIGSSYFDFFRNAGAATVCSPWSYPTHASLEWQIDKYVWEHPDFLPVFPSGNTFGQGSQPPHAPCGAKNILCIGASFNERETYVEQPSFVHAVLRAEDSSCASSDSNCSQEIRIVPAFFGTTAPLDLEECQAMGTICLSTQSACPECAFDASMLGGVSKTRVVEASPREGCSAMVAFPRGAVCLVYRGNCVFDTKAKMCADAGAVGVIVVNYAATDETLLVGSDSGSSALRIPVVLISKEDAVLLLASRRLVSFPLVSAGLSPAARAPYSAFGAVAGGRARPEVVFPGDNIASTASGLGCGTRYMSGTSQSCGFAAGSVALVREYLQGHADARTSRLGLPWASTMRAVVAAAAHTKDEGSTWQEEVGFGLPVLANVLPMGASAAAGSIATDLHALQSRVGGGQTQQFCFSVQAAQPPGVAPSFVLAWTDPPHSAGLLVNDLNLALACSQGGWKTRLSNGRGAADAANTIEKVVLNDLSQSGASPQVCVASVSFTSGSPAAVQPFSLVATGRMALVPGCETPSARPSCGMRGNAARGSNGTNWVCVCADDWFGPSCEQQSTPIKFNVDGAGPAVLPWNWDFRVAEACGEGDYEFELSGFSPDSVSVVASTFSGPHLWASAAAARPSATWSDGTSEISLEQTAARSVVSVRLGAATGDVGSSGSVSSSQLLHIALFNRGRDGSRSFALRWVRAPPSCGFETSQSLRGSSSATALSSSGALIGLYCSLALVASVLTCIAVRLYFRRKRLAMVAPAPPPSCGVPACEVRQAPVTGKAS
mmetsp:Transcript_167119/g.536745  ORF Transcript_167119/g.536745 Transcript_167119/m.536745 type:complete len:973 (-) Transcript_167119:200-3118(-)